MIILYIHEFLSYRYLEGLGASIPPHSQDLLGVVWALNLAQMGSTLYAPASRAMRRCAMGPVETGKIPYGVIRML